MASRLPGSFISVSRRAQNAWKHILSSAQSPYCLNTACRRPIPITTIKPWNCSTGRTFSARCPDKQSGTRIFPEFKGSVSHYAFVFFLSIFPIACSAFSCTDSRASININSRSESFASSPAGVEDCLPRLPFIPFAGESWIGGFFPGGESEAGAEVRERAWQVSFSGAAMSVRQIEAANKMESVFP
jgi:hypothetical protein